MPATPKFQIVGLPHEPFARYFAAPDAQLAQAGARRVTADQSPGFPCRISLQDAEVGEELLLLSYQHLPGDSPYRASGPIYVRRGATVCEGTDVAPQLERMLGERRVEYIQLHNAKPGCYSCRVIRPNQRRDRYGRIANARAGKPNPFSTFGQVTTMTAPVAGTLSRFAITSIWK